VLHRCASTVGRSGGSGSAPRRASRYASISAVTYSRFLAVIGMGLGSRPRACEHQLCVSQRSVAQSSVYRQPRLSIRRAAALPMNGNETLTIPPRSARKRGGVRAPWLLARAPSHRRRLPASNAGNKGRNRAESCAAGAAGARKLFMFESRSCSRPPGLATVVTHAPRRIASTDSRNDSGGAACLSSSLDIDRLVAINMNLGGRRFKNDFPFQLTR